MTCDVAVLGAAGYLGRHVTLALRRRGFAVAALTRGGADRRAEPGFTLCDAADARTLLRQVRGADCVINAVSAPPSVMVRIGENLHTLLRRDAIGRVIQVSSLSVFGQDQGVLHEGIRPLPAHGHAYAKAKLRTEAILTAEEDIASRILIIRPGCLYGPGAPVWVDRIARLLQARRLGWLGRQGEGRCLLIHAEDLAAAIANNVERRISGTYNLVPPDLISWNDYFFRLASLIGALPLRSIGPAALAAEAWLTTPLHIAAGRLTGEMAIGVTPAMRRQFASQARIVSVRAPIYRWDQFRPLQVGCVEVAKAFNRRAVAIPDSADARLQPVAAS